MDAIAGAGTMLVHDMSEWVSHREPNADGVHNAILGPLEPPDLLTAVDRDIYLDLAPRPETRLQDGAVWIASFPDASQATLFLSQVTSAYREAEGRSPIPGRSPISEFEVPGIDGARGLLARWLTGRGGPNPSPNATIWFQVDDVVAAVDINFGGDFVTDEWPTEFAVHLATWLHSALSAQITGQQVSGPDAPVPTPPSEALVGDVGSPGAGCGEGCRADNWDMNVKAPVLAAMLDPFDAIAEIIGCSATSTTTVQLYPGDDGFRDAVVVRCLFQISGDR